jgi:hypothetical protein
MPAAVANRVRLPAHGLSEPVESGSRACPCLAIADIVTRGRLFWSGLEAAIRARADRRLIFVPTFVPTASSISFRPRRGSVSRRRTQQVQ